jgi:hypothetical protein
MCVWGDEDITPMDTHDTLQVATRGAITREQAWQINLQLTSFLCTLFHDYVNKLLPNDIIIIIRKYLDDKEVLGKRHGGGKAPIFQLTVIV